MKNQSKSPYSPWDGFKNMVGVGLYLLILGLGLEALTLLLRQWIAFPINLILSAQIILTIPCAAFCILGVIWFNLSFRPTELLEGEVELVTHGPYGYVRHPIYAILMLTIPPLFIIWFADLIFTAPWVLTTLLSPYLVRLEERSLVERFGQDYIAYRGYVPALLPFKGDGGRRFREDRDDPDLESAD